MTATGYETAKATDAAPVPPPVRPLSSVLPFHALTFEQFQDFCTALLIDYYDGATVHQYGGPGDTQLGIDIDVKLRDGRHYTFQCKREAKFGKEKVRKAIKEHAVDCDLAVVLLSRPATAEARDEVKRKRKKKWGLWDAKDIADRIRSLPEFKRLRLIDTYFPAHRKDFLGIEQPSVFETPEKYFAPFLKRSYIFSHTWTLAGRDKELAQINAAFAGPSEGTLLIAGAGGIGKTRLLRTVLEEYRTQNPRAPIFVLPSTAQPSPKDYEIISGQDGLVVVEDAHDRLDVKAVAHVLARLEPPQKVIVTCRPYALSATRGDLESVGLPIAPGFPLTISGLTVDDAETVASQILKAKNGPPAAAKDIAVVTHDSPLALVIGAHLVATKFIHPKTLNNADEFRQRLLEGFRDAISGTIGLPSEQQLIRATLELVALLQPVEVDTSSFAAITAKLTDHPIPEIKRAIQLLLEAGVLVRRARKIRIVPDLLGDYLIEEVLGRDGGHHSAIAQQLLAEADAEQVAHFLVNTAKLDWRLSAKDEGRQPLSDVVWSQLISGSAETLPEKLLEGVVTAAYYQPEPALRLYDRVVSKNAAPKGFTRLLRNVAMNMEFVERACERLWTLGRDDTRAENQIPDHPMRILKELAQIEPAKPVEYCERIANFAMARLLARRDTLPLYGVLESALSADGHTTRSTGLSITFRSFSVRHAAVRELRQKIIDFLFQQLTREFLPSAVRAASVFLSALRFPDHIGTEARKDWENEFVSTLDRLVVAVGSATLDPNALVAIEKAVHWHAGFGAGPAHEAAKRVLAAIPQTLDYRVTLCIADAWGNTRMGRDDAHGWIERWREEQTDVARAVLKEHTDYASVVAFIRSKLTTIREAGNERNSTPGQFVGILASLDESVAKALCEVATIDPEMRILFSGGLFALMRLNPTQGIDTAKAALSADIIELSRDVTWCLAARQGREQTISEERTLLMSLLSHTDPFVVGSALRGAVSGGLDDPSALAATLLEANLGESKHVASEFFGEVMRNEPISSALTVESLIPTILAKIQDLPTIEDFWIEKYLFRVSEVAPLALVEFLLARITADISDTERKMQPLPYLWDEKLPFSARTSPRFKDALRRIREWMVSAPDHWAVRFWAPKLYVAIAGGVDEEIVRDLLEWTDTHDEAKFGVVVDLLREAPSEFALENVSAVRALFDRAEAMGPEVVKDLRSSLFSAAISGMRHGTPGQPFPEDARRKTKSQEALAQLPSGSPVFELYVALARDAEGDIRRKKEEDDALIEEYE